MEIFNYFRAVWHQKVMILILIVFCSLMTGIITFYTFEPYYVGEYQVTINLAGELQEDARNSDWFVSTVQGWLESAEFRNKVDFGFEAKKTSWQNLIVVLSADDEEVLKSRKEVIERNLDLEVERFNFENNNVLQISNRLFSSLPAENHPVRNAIFGGLFGLLLGIMVAFVREEID